jgi:tRNA(fMet)-specific endonuclease VapC
MQQSRLFMLDTNIVSVIAHHAPVSIEKRIQAVSAKFLCISVITKAELLYGLAWNPDAIRLAASVQEFLAHIDSLPWNDAAAASYAMLRTSLRRNGMTLGDMDMMIAAHALALDAVLVTNDKSFRHVKGLTTEDWTKA